MKKIIFIGFISIFCFQSFGQSQSKIGLRLGANFSKTRINESLFFNNYYSTGTGITAGVFMINNPDEKINFQPEFLFSYFGDGAFNCSNISVPLQLKWGKSSAIKFLAGPELDYLLSYRTNSSVRLNNNISKLALNGSFGFEYNINSAMSLSFRYSMPLISYRTSNGQTINIMGSNVDLQGMKIKNSGIFISLGYLVK